MILKMSVRMCNYKDEVIQKISDKMKGESGADAGSNWMLGFGAAIVVIGLLLTAIKAWLPDAFTTIADKALEIIGVN